MRFTPFAIAVPCFVAACSSSDSSPSQPPDASLADSSVLDASIGDDADGAMPRDAAPPIDAGTPYPGAAALPKFVSPLPIPPVWVPASVVSDDAGAALRESYAIDVATTMQQVLPDGYAATSVLAYGGAARMPDGTVNPHFRGWPAATFEAKRGVPIDVTWTNALQGITHPFPVDPTVHWADPNDAGMPSAPFAPYPPGYASAQSPIPIVTHLHGGEVEPASDGFPLDWFLPGQSKTDHYPNAQRATTLWYHDHALGLVRLNVYAGLAGFYVLRDGSDTLSQSLPSGKYEIPIVIQDRAFHADGSIQYTASATTPVHHPYWNMEFFGDAIVVNGRTWPNLDVEPRAYRFRLLNGSNARFYRLAIVDAGADAGTDAGSASIPITQIGSDGGYLASPVTLDSLVLAPAERADVIVDFSGHPGAKLRVINDAPAPYPNGTAPDPSTTGQILQFTVAAGTPQAPPSLPATLDAIPTLTADAPKRTLTLLEPNDEFGQSLTMLLNGQHWDAPASETPRVGSTEDWEIVNLGDESHPVHLHLVQFQIVSRQTFDAATYLADWTTLNGNPTWPVMGAVQSLDPKKYLTGSPTGPEANERGWKDTVVVPLGQVVTIRVRFAPAKTAAGASAPGMNLFAFNPTTGNGYVWHCHILEHEDNEMMRPLLLTP